MIELRAWQVDGKIAVSGTMEGNGENLIRELAGICASALVDMSKRYEGEDDILGMLEQELVRVIADQLRVMTGEAD